MTDDDLSAEQLAALDLRESVALSAGAGSGKTRVLVERYVRALDDVNGDVDRVLAVTFTDKAAAEMRGRIREKLRRRAGGSTRDLRLDEAWIGTIHSACLRLLRTTGPEEGRVFRLRLLDAEGARAEFEAAAVEVVDRAADLPRDEPTAAALRRLLRFKSRGEIRDALGELLARREVAEPWAAAALAETPAARAGRLREVVEARIRTFCLRACDARRPPAWAAAARELAVHRAAPGAKGRKSSKATELADALISFAAAVETRDPEALRTAVTAALADGVSPHRDTKKLTWPEEELRALRDSQTRFAVDLDLPKGTPTWALAGGTPPAEEVAALERAQDLARLFDAALRRVRARRAARETTDFQGLLEEADRLLAEPAVGPRFAERFKHVLVDEFQDADPLQWRLLRRLVGGDRVRRGGLLLVGDEKQAIYAFRGGDVATFRGASEEIGAATVVGVRRTLRDNYRSTPGLVAFVNAVQEVLFASPEEAPPYAAARGPMNALRRTTDDFTSSIEVLVAVREGAEDGDVDDAAAEAASDDGAASGADEIEPKAAEIEARIVAERIRRFLDEGTTVEEARRDLPPVARPARLSDMAILLRTRALLPAIEDALGAAGLPFRVFAGTGFFSRREITWLVRALRFATHPADDATALAVLRSPLAGVSDSVLVAAEAVARRRGVAHLPLFEKVAAFADDVAAGRATPPTAEDGALLVDAVRRLRRALRTARRLAADEWLATLVAESDLVLALEATDPSGASVANVDLLIDKVRAAAARGDASFEAVVAELVAASEDALRAEQAERPVSGDDVVAILTEHAAKGLEWPIVLLPGAGQSLDAAPPGIVEAPVRLGDGGAPWTHDGVRDPDEKPTLVAELTKLRRKSERHAEAARLFYVALTRARDRLVITGSTNAHGKIHSRSRLARLEEVASADRAVFGAGPGRAEFVRRVTRPGEALRSRGAAPLVPPFAPLGEGGLDRAGLRVEAPASAAWKWLVCPRRFLLEEVLGASDVSESASATSGEDGDGGRAKRVDPRVRGIVIHAGLEARFSGGDAARRAADAAFEAGLRDEEAVKELVGLAVEAAAAFEGSAPGRRAAAAPPSDVLAERPLTFASGEVRFFGRPDLVVVDAAGVLVVDFKTSAPKSERDARRRAVAAGYDAQLEIYAAALRRATGMDVAATLFFTGSAVDVTVVGGAGAAMSADDAARKWEAQAATCGGPPDRAFPMTHDAGICRKCPHLATGLCRGAT